MQVGIVGYSGVGKTTLFNTLTGLAASTGYGSKRQVNTGVIDVPDARIDKLTELCNPKRTVLAKITFTDVPGQAPGQGGALDAQMLQEIRNVDALAHVVRAFNSEIHDPPNPLGEVRNFQDELKLADQLVIEKRLERLRKEGKDKATERDLLESLLAHLEGDQPLRTLDLDEQTLSTLSGFRFLSLKTTLIVFNVAEDALNTPATEALLDEGRALGFDVFALSAALEEEIAQLDEDEQRAFLDDLGLTETARGRFIRAAYAVLNLISFLTSGTDEVRAWTVKKGVNARRAARAIHSDLERGFIRAKVISFDDFVLHGSEVACRDKGLERLEGKDYIVKDGDILHILANV